MNQIERKAIFTQQNEKCALCAVLHTTPKGMCYVPKQNTLVCRRCNTFLHTYKAMIKHNITSDILAAFLEREPAPSPQPQRKAKKLSPGQLEGLQFILNGRSDLTIEEWCRMAKVTEAEAMNQLADI